MDYSPAIGPLLCPTTFCPLGPGKPNEETRPALEALQPDTAFAPHSVRNADMAAACLAALWLRHNFLDQAHSLSQNIDTQTGSYWHGLMHRREPDFANAAYWFRRVGAHSVFPAVRDAAATVAAATADPAARFLVEQGVWNPFDFIELCERCLGSGGGLEVLCQQIQQREWEILFDYCYRAATAASS